MARLFAEIEFDIEFDDLPWGIQEQIETLADKRGLDIDSLWYDIKYGETAIPKRLRKELRTASKLHDAMYFD